MPLYLRRLESLLVANVNRIEKFTRPFYEWVELRGDRLVNGLGKIKQKRMMEHTMRLRLHVGYHVIVHTQIQQAMVTRMTASLVSSVRCKGVISLSTPLGLTPPRA